MQSWLAFGAFIETARCRSYLWPQEKSELLVPGGHLVRLIQYLKSLAAELIDGGYNEALTVTALEFQSSHTAQGTLAAPT